MGGAPGGAGEAAGAGGVTAAPGGSSSGSPPGASGSSREELSGIWEVLSLDDDGRPFLDRCVCVWCVCDAACPRQPKTHISPPCPACVCAWVGWGRGAAAQRKASQEGGKRRQRAAAPAYAKRAITPLYRAPALCALQARRVGPRGPAAALCAAATVWPVAQLPAWHRHAQPTLACHSPGPAAGRAPIKGTAAAASLLGPAAIPARAHPCRPPRSFPSAHNVLRCSSLPLPSPKPVPLPRHSVSLSPPTHVFQTHPERPFLSLPNASDGAALPSLCMTRLPCSLAPARPTPLVRLHSCRSDAPRRMQPTRWWGGSRCAPGPPRASSAAQPCAARYPSCPVLSPLCVSVPLRQASQCTRPFL